MKRPIALITANADVEAARVNLWRARQRLERAESNLLAVNLQLPPGRECGTCGAGAYQPCDKSKH